MIDYSFSYGDLEYFLLILMRVSGFIFAAPFFSMTNVPTRVRMGLSVFITILLSYSLPKMSIEYDGLIQYSILVMKETVTGILIGFGAKFCQTIVNFAGHIADMEAGLSMVTLFDPATKEQTSISGAYYNYSITLMLVLSGVYRYLISAFAETYTLIPINGAVFNGDKLMSAFIGFMTNYLIIGFRICLPVFAVMIILNCILGILAKVSPQMNMFAVGMQMKVLVGLGVLFLTTTMIPSAGNFIFEQMKRVVVSFVMAMQQ